MMTGDELELDDDLRLRLERVHGLADDVPAGPWRHYRSDDGALILEDANGEPLALVYGGLPVARYLEACSPAVLFEAGE